MHRKTNLINVLLTFSWLTDEMTREDALQMLRDLEPSKSERIAQLERTGFPGKFNPHKKRVTV